MSVPQIRTALPKRRYQLGEFIVSVLGDVESGDGIEYRYIMAVAREADPRPHLFIAAERNDAGAGRWRLRVAMADGSQVLGADDAYGDIDNFVAHGLSIISRVLSLTDEEPFRLV